MPPNSIERLDFIRFQQSMRFSIDLYLIAKHINIDRQILPTDAYKIGEAASKHKTLR